LLHIQVGTGISGEKQGAAIAKGQAASPAPGMLESHYAPSKPLYLLSGKLSAQKDPVLEDALLRNPSRIGVLLMTRTEESDRTYFSNWTKASIQAISLSVSGDLSEIAKNLFSGLRELDHSDAEILITEPCETSEGLGHAISDRIRRASAK